MLKIRSGKSLLFAVILTVVLVAGLIPASGAVVANAEDNGRAPYEDCDWDNYDDSTLAPVPWAHFDETAGDVIPKDWDGVAGSYQEKHDAEQNANSGSDGSISGGNSSGGSDTSGTPDQSAAGGSDIPGGSDQSATDGATGGSNSQSPAGGSSEDSGSEQVSTEEEDDLIKTFGKISTPKITGTAKVGKTLKVKVGAWRPAPAFRYQWYANDKAIKGATKPSYKLKKAQKGKKIKVKVTATKSGYETETRISGATKKVR
jgi:hypothetical protein